MGIRPKDLESFVFRVKQADQPANRYAVTATGKKDNQHVTITESTKNLICSTWGHGFFKLNACDYCDDVMGETADVSVGDAWLKAYESDSLGNNVVIFRNLQLLDFVQKHYEELSFDEVSAKTVYASQAGGFRHRREGLQYRLYLKDIAGEYRPIKRVKALNIPDSSRKKIYRSRLQLTQVSKQAYNKAIEKDDFNNIKESVQPYLEEYSAAYAIGFVRKLRWFAKRMIKLFKLPV